MGTKTYQLFPGVRGEAGMTRWDTGSEGSETPPYDTLMVDTCYHVFVKSYRTYNTESEP